MADPPSPHPAVWTSQMLVLSVVVFSVAFGVGSAIFKRPASVLDADDDEEEEDE